MKFTEFLEQKNRLDEFNRTKSSYSFFITLPEDVKNEFSPESINDLNVKDTTLIYYMIDYYGLTKGSTLNAFLNEIKRKVMKTNEVTDEEKLIMLDSGKLTQEFFEDIIHKKRKTIRDFITNDKQVANYNKEGFTSRKNGTINFDTLFKYISTLITREVLDSLNGIKEILLFVPSIVGLLLSGVKSELDLLNTYVNLDSVICNIRTSVLSGLVFLKLTNDLTGIREKYKEYGRKPEYQPNQITDEIIKIKQQNNDVLDDNQYEYLKLQYANKSDIKCIFDESILDEMDDQDRQKLSDAYAYFKLFNIKIHESYNRKKLIHIYRLLVTFILNYITLQKGFDLEHNDFLAPTIRNTLPNDLRQYTEKEIAEYFADINLKNVKLPSLLSFELNNIPGALRNRALRINLGNRAKRFATLAFDEGMLDLEKLQKNEQVILRFLIMCDKLGVLIYNLDSHKHSESVNQKRTFKYSRKIWVLITKAMGCSKYDELIAKYELISQRHPDANYNKTAQLKNIFNSSDEIINPNTNEPLKENETLFEGEDVAYWISRYLFQKNWKCYYYNEILPELDELLYKGSGLHYYKNMINFNNQVWDQSSNKNINKLISINNSLHYYDEPTREDYELMAEKILAVDLTTLEFKTKDIDSEINLLNNLELNDKPTVVKTPSKTNPKLDDEYPRMQSQGIGNASNNNKTSTNHDYHFDFKDPKFEKPGKDKKQEKSTHEGKETKGKEEDPKINDNKEEKETTETSHPMPESPTSSSTNNSQNHNEMESILKSKTTQSSNDNKGKKASTQDRTFILEEYNESESYRSDLDLSNE